MKIDSRERKESETYMNLHEVVSNVVESDVSGIVEMVSPSHNVAGVEPHLPVQ
jgi:hypothetical protein